MTDLNTLITDHLDVWTTAIETKSGSGRGNSNKQVAFGVKKLRGLILELAVRGKLVSQNSNDGLGREVLDASIAERGRLVIEKQIKKQKALPPISSGEEPYEIPSTWCFARLGDITNYGQTDKAEPSDVTEDTWILELEDIEKSTSRLLKRTSFAEKPFKSSKNRFKAGDVVYGKLRPYLDKVLVAKAEGVCTTEMVPMSPYSDFLPEFLRWILKSPTFIRYADDTTHGMNLPRLGTENARLAVIPVAPIDEQRRIVAKVDELMALCDALEAQTEDSLKAHQTLVETCLTTLTNSQSPEELIENWTRIETHFDSLFTTPESVASLRRSLQKLAVLGAFSTGVGKEESMHQLHLKITQERDLSITEGKRKNKKPLVDFTGLNELKAPLPKGWVWVQVDEVAETVRGGSPRPAGDPRFYNGDIPFLKVADVTRISGKMVEGYSSTIKEAGLKKTRFVGERTLLLSNSGATLGYPAIVDFPATFNDGIAAFLHLSEFVHDEFLFHYLASLTGWFLSVASRGQGQPNLNTDIIKATWLPVPPLAEQIRITTLIDRLFRYCDELSEKQKQKNQVARLLADAIV